MIELQKHFFPYVQPLSWKYGSGGRACIRVCISVHVWHVHECLLRKRVCMCSGESS